MIEKKKKLKKEKKEKSKKKEESTGEQVGFPDDVDFNKFLGCGG